MERNVVNRRSRSPLRELTTRACLFAGIASVATLGCGPTAEELPTGVTLAAMAAGPGDGVDEVRIRLDLERDQLKFGFIKLTDCAPLAIAKEKGFFSDEGLNVELEPQPNWKTLLDRVISGELDGAHMLSGQPLAATVGIGSKASIVTAFTMDRNGNAITVSNAVWKEMRERDPALNHPTPAHPISADALKPIVDARKVEGRPLRMATVFPVSTHNYELRYWLAASGIAPGMYGPDDHVGETGADVLLSVTPPPQMPSALEQGTIQGYCVGEPWNQQAVAKQIGVPVVTSGEIYRGRAEKVFGVTQAWSEANPQTHVAVVKALIRAGKWLDETDTSGNLVHREEASRILSRPEYVGADFEVIANSMTGHFYFQKTDKRALRDFNVFFADHATYPWYSDGVWFLTQMRRWGQIGESKPDDWYHEIAHQVYRPDVYLKAAEILLAEGSLEEADVPETDGYRPPTNEFIDGIVYDGRHPVAYLRQHAIGNQN